MAPAPVALMAEMATIRNEQAAASSSHGGCLLRSFSDATTRFSIVSATADMAVTAVTCDEARRYGDNTVVYYC